MQTRTRSARADRALGIRCQAPRYVKKGRFALPEPPHTPERPGLATGFFPFPIPPHIAGLSRRSGRLDEVRLRYSFK